MNRVTIARIRSWLADRVQERDPLARVPFYPETERRRSKRILTDAELEKVVAAAEKSRRRVGKLTGRQRAMLYRVAAYTGLRAGELAKLRREHFHLDAKSDSPFAKWFQRIEAGSRWPALTPVPARG